MKGAVDPVTEVDVAAEQAIFDVLRRHRPTDATLGEESGGSDSRGRQWVVDALDGTVNFVHGLAHTAVSVALWSGGEAVVGVIADVERARLHRAESGAGAEVDGEATTVTDAMVGDAVVATGYPYDRRERAAEYGAMTGRLLAEFRGVRRFGAAALDFAWVAEGRLDGYGEVGLQPWDAAAGILLVRESGGVVLDGSGRPAGLRSRAFACGNATVARRLSEIVGAAV
jgi:myo-inositol-1(or 4)-monophosphatase